MADRSTRVLIVGGGPAGLVLAIELGRRGVPCILFEQSSGPPRFPKANSTTSRTMEHYRRLGIADEIRALGLPARYPPDISYHTRFGGHELARLRWPSRQDALASRHHIDAHWPTPEPVHRAQQMFIEAVLKRHAEQCQAVDMRFGWRVEDVTTSEGYVAVRARDLARGRAEEFTADYAVGCDGPRSIVRQALGITYEGIDSEDGEFLGGRMLATHLDAPLFYQSVGVPPSWQYWALNRQRSGILVAIDGKGRFVFHTQLPRGRNGSLEYARESLALATGSEFPHEILDIAEWTAGLTLVATRYGSDRIFLAGDAAHLFTPTAGLGYNTSVDDAANLGWKLAAACRGWGGPSLLATYEIERKPIALRNTQFARSIADFFRSLDVPVALEEDSQEGDRARAVLGQRLHELATREFDAPGVHFGAYYDGSPIVAVEPGARPPQEPNRYIPHARPGARAPHLWIAEGQALYDRFGRDFTLLDLSDGLDVSPVAAAARRRGIGLEVLRLRSKEARDLYQCDLALIRPDHHIAWRGDRVPHDIEAVVDRSVGFG
jgi:2-polyprenyl-6-methoxyphenol hydroxylase-like FAD-dependent oxidoreductase